MSSTDKDMSFWQHLDDLRSVLLKMLFTVAVLTVVLFFFKDWLFAVLFAPAKEDFIIYRLMRQLAELTGWESLNPGYFEAHFINTELASQFMTHLQMSLWTAVCLAAPYIIYLLYGFIAPALYEKEKRYSVAIVLCCVLLFLLGLLLNYFIIFPFSFRFLSTYQVQPEVINQISLTSYISSFLIMSLMMGVMFELPVLVYLLARLGLLKASTLRRFRRHAFVGILIIAAVITPTGDAVTLMLVSLPVYALYELSILAIRRFS